MKYIFVTLIFLILADSSFCQISVSDSAMVVTAHPLATKVGVDVLKAGGNAFDAMLAVHFALAVVYPRAGNLGGGGFMVYRKSNGSTNTLDFREKAPAASHPDLYLDEKGEVTEGLSLNTHLASGVPGSVDGVLSAQEMHGSIFFADLLQPAIQLALDGFKLTKIEAEALNKFRGDIEDRNEPNIWTSNAEWKEGDLIQLQELAQTIERIQQNGRDGFYSGETAELIVSEMNSGNGIITKEDLENYRSVWRQPIIGFYDEYKIISMPPPSSGGIALLQILKYIEKFPLDKWGPMNKKTIHAIVEAERRAYADRATHLGDPDYYDVPVYGLLNNYYLEDRFEDFNKRKASKSEVVNAGSPPVIESEETTHYSIVDQFGNAVSVTTTLNANYGSKIFVDGAGFFMNNEMDDFSAKPGVPNLFGLIGGEANKVESSKRMLSSMTPTIIEKNGRAFMVLGSPGGSTIITSVLQVFLNVAEHGMNMQEAVDQFRFHHQWLPDDIFVEENAFEPKLRKKLLKMGHKFKERKSIGRVDAILIDEKGVLYSGADKRGDDTAGGF